MMVSYDVISGLVTLGIQELFSYRTLMLHVLVRLEGTCVYKSEPLISALTQKPTLTPINACLIKIVKPVLLHFLEQIPFWNPGDTSWPLNRQLPVSSQLTPDSCGLVFVVWVFLVIGVRIEERVRMDIDRWGLWSLHRQPAYHQSPKHYHWTLKTILEGLTKYCAVREWLNVFFPTLLRDLGV